MRGVVTSGTARRAGFDRVAATVYGKTGTAQVGAEWRPMGQRVSDGPWHHWFVGFSEAPGRRPLAFACVLHGRMEAASGTTAAKAVADILEYWYSQGDR